LSYYFQLKYKILNNLPLFSFNKFIKENTVLSKGKFGFVEIFEEIFILLHIVVCILYNKLSCGNVVFHVFVYLMRKCLMHTLMHKINNFWT
jgi:hypothetical protein